MNSSAIRLSSLLISYPMMAANLVLGLLAAYFGFAPLAAAFILLLLLALLARLWKSCAGKKLYVFADCERTGFFPGDEVPINITVKNDKFVPVIWSELEFPLPENLCIMPENTRPAEEWELSGLETSGFSKEAVGYEHMPALLWYANAASESSWTAVRRGICDCSSWILKTGDGFGLAQTGIPVFARSAAPIIAVYPKLISVKTALFMRNFWNSQTGRRGNSEDVTVIRTSRAYTAGDPMKRINWRLAARNLPLSVNLYEEVLPSRSQFIFDGASFAQDPDALEEALSILASELAELFGKLECGISIPRGKANEELTLLAPETIEDLLLPLASYDPIAPQKNADDEKPELPLSIFETATLMGTSLSIGHYYFISYSSSFAVENELLKNLDRERVTVLTYEDPEPIGECSVFSLRGLKEDGHE